MRVPLFTFCQHCTCFSTRPNFDDLQHLIILVVQNIAKRTTKPSIIYRLQLLSRIVVYFLLELCGKITVSNLAPTNRKVCCVHLFNIVSCKITYRVCSKVLKTLHRCNVDKKIFDMYLPCKHYTLVTRLYFFFC